MKARFSYAAALLFAFAMGSESGAGVIGPGDFGPQAQIETFDFGTVGYVGPGPLVSDGVTYSFDSPDYYKFVAYDPNSPTCVSGVCLSSYLDNASLTITLDNPANRVGGYLTGNVDWGNSNIRYFDASSAFLGSGKAIPSVSNGGLSFFGFESLADPIGTIELFLHPGPASFQLDNFTTEIVTPLPAALPLFASGVGALGLLGWRRRRK
jgi:hypothetical protein